ncbi:MAG: xanthine dehydrogenase family protein subunit M [Anaerolineales bacterium]|nr:xanthine dehydrogenase family protein subunit M [Anaerolineales bacterium]
MKPPPFEYYAPTTVEEALALLAEYGYDAKPLAGGQSLIPMMNFRLAQPSVLVDLNNIPELSYIHRDENGGLLIGAMARHNMVQHDPLIAERAPLVHDAMPKIGTPQIRTRGTFGGSLSHADPSAELGAVSVALNGRFRLRSKKGERWVPANEFFVGLFTSVLEPEELLIEINLPRLSERSGWSLMEVARRHNDFALIGVAAVVSLGKNGSCEEARLVFLSAGDGPVGAHQAAELLKGQKPTAEAIQAAAEKAASADIDPGSDIHATAEFRRHLAKVLARRALNEAFERANGR